MKNCNIVTGATELMVLISLKEKDRYTYEIQKLLKEASGGTIDIPYASIYPVVYRLKEKGYISGYDIREKRKIRVILHLEEKGRFYLKELLQEYQNVLGTIEFLNGGKINPTDNEGHVSA